MGIFKTLAKVVLTCASMLAVASAVHAADPVIDAPEMHDWSGLYLGLHAGYGWGGRDYDDDDGIWEDNGEFEYDLHGAVAGAQIGFNFQIDSFVFGIEADGSWTDMRDTENEVFIIFPTNAESEVEWLATVRGRLGFAWDRFLVYGTGGVAFAGVDTDANTSLIIVSLSDSDSASHTGWTAGLGIEGMLTEHLSLKAEYLHADFDKKKFEYFGGGLLGSSGKAGLDVDIVRLGLNWHF